MSNMNRFKIFICLTVAIASFVACGSEEKSDSQLLKEKRELKQDLFEKRIEEFNRKHKPYYNWDTLDMKYSFMYRNVLLSEKQIIINPEIRDIIWQDSTYIFSVCLNNYYTKYPSYHFDLKTNNDQLVSEIINISSYRYKLILLVDINHLKKIELETNIDKDYEVSLIDFDLDDFYGEGSIINYDVIDTN